MQMGQGEVAHFAGKNRMNDSQQASIADAIAGAAYIRAISPSYGIPEAIEFIRLFYYTRYEQGLTSLQRRTLCGIKGFP